MKLMPKLIMADLTIIIAITLLISCNAFADGTPSGTNIDNMATINYQVGGINQAIIESSPSGNSTPGAGNGAVTTFVVDNKVDLTVTTVDAGAVIVLPGSTQAGGAYNVLEFTIQNDGNTTQDYALSATAVTTGSATAFDGEDDDFDMTPATINVFVESGANAGYQVGEDTATFIDALAMETSATVYIVADTPATAVNNQYASYHLLATTHTDTGPGLGVVTTADTGVWDSTSVQVVFADAQGSDTTNEAATPDGMHSSQDDYRVVTATLTVVKTSVVDSDPFGSANPKAVPGAIVEYTIDITNNGSASATTVEITDSIPANTVFVVGSITAGDTIEYSDDNGATWTYVPVGVTDANVTDISVTFNTIANGASASTDFQVEIQ